ncbi:hypothetical protein DYBT9623_00005 [Dyadobacter sp. CECT 9623]|uniref:Uncharacterized protein n=1 Tax=Dyadobacter linearis TaxID=2823330 RepID=A0ABM8UIQ3_9BACT|nr:hypothetical protein DYBT9623_00005 [Dyadobacter sp. CECT 9623]
MCFIAFNLVNVYWLSIVYLNWEDGRSSSDREGVWRNSAIMVLSEFVPLDAELSIARHFSLNSY